ncbi:MAG: TerB family tellurite resistance protein [Pseudomonadota bacterium]
MIVVDQIKNWLEQDKSVRRVAEDIQLTSELILLVRMIFADGELKPQELHDFKQICKIAFGIPEEDVADVLKYLREFGYETTAEDAAAMFQNLEPERKRTLLVHMLSIAKSDQEIHSQEAELIRKTASVLGVNAQDFADSQ